MPNAVPARNRSWTGLDRVMRSIHLYTGLFLAPWMIIYALSGFLLNHGKWIHSTFQIQPPQWELVRETPFEPDQPFSDQPPEQARAILRHLDLDGPHHIQGKPTDREMIVLRASGRGHYRVTWLKDLKVLRVHQQQPASWLRLTHFLHFRHGYQQPYVSTVTWAVLVDLAVASMIFWVVSGIYLWARRPNRKRLGGVLLGSGLALFVWLVVVLCE